MKLGPHHIPFPESIRLTVLDEYQPPVDIRNLALQDQHLDLVEAIRYLRDITDFSSTRRGITSQTEAIGDPAVLAPELAALVDWVDKAFDIFEQEAPLEPQLAEKLAQLRPLAAAVAISDPRFCTPGNHPLHQLLDALNAAAIGWLPTLGRSGQAVIKLFDRAASDARLWFTDPESNLSALADDVIKQTAKDLARAQRMCQRVVDTEKGRARASSARAQATRCINDLLKDNLAPASVGDFIKGPWFDSLQLVVLKFGAESREWEQANQITRILLDTLQAREQDETRRQYIFSTVPKVAQHLRRWLLSLQHDPHAITDAISVVEYAHMRILRQQELELEIIEPLPEVPDAKRSARAIDSARENLVNRVEPGQWFCFHSDAGETDRLQLALKLEDEKQLLFTNQAGVKAGQYSYADFANLLASTSVRKLPREYAFTLSLAAAAGIKTQADLLKASPIAAEQARERAQEEQLQALEDRAGDARTEHQPETETQQPSELLTAASAANDRSGTQKDREPPELRELGLEEELSDTEIQNGEDDVFELTLDPELGEEDGFYDLTDGDQLVEEVHFPEPPGLDTPESSIDSEFTQEPKVDQPTAETVVEGQVEVFLQPAQHDREEPASELPGAPAEPENDIEDSLELDEIIAAADRDNADSSSKILPVQSPTPEILIGAQGAGQQAPQERNPREGVSEHQGHSTDSACNEDLDIPMGSWLGFHDRHTPMMAKLAVHDRERGAYIFVNREGIKLRELSRQELDDLVNSDLVELLEARTNFREALAALRSTGTED